ncbi:phosphatidylinositol N-acetylglucosaminyltransferase subunit Q isoform X2 [Anoplophora glabripennis]|uniref:phosphatidylinositol N-acetylglucosaminyltransferase subunit Q isoform X2 n=1 Tax=Anoplophora glabripennis TaxID=217634 RepID=UPI00087529C1|nr:phosphatidylinositol N-acetylglucosaminyltransferase subunit Q isoform X2 [Anoplophora glabripennis]
MAIMGAVLEGDSYGKHFKFIAEELRKSNLDGLKINGRKSFLASTALIIIFILNVILKVLNILKPMLQYSATFLHFENNALNLRWFLEEIVGKKKLSPKTGNMLVAKIVDLVIGIVLLNWFLRYESSILNFIETIIEDIITNLKGLLLYLMGSPIGLKLNHSFNNTLGKFFFYHISLWRVFLQGTEPLLRAYFKYLVLPGALGFSFQTAMFSDIVSIATFHVYCIYVYAARLFLLQIRGLASLWRLFIGRKLNPLRERVDSCKYTPDQLFIGTLGFTILLFLLPTTAMYYTVFTTFRLAIILANGLLLRAIFLLNTLPLYVLVLWIFNSSSVAGTVYITWRNDEDTEKVVVEAKLNPLPLTNSIKKFVPDSVGSVEGKSYSYILHSMFTGMLL